MFRLNFLYSALQAAQGADALVQAAVLLEARDFLWDTAFPRFLAASHGAAFLAALVPRILEGRLTALSPEVVQVSRVRQLLDSTASGTTLHRAC